MDPVLLIEKRFRSHGGQSRPDGKSGLRRYFALYTGLFCLVCCLVFCWYFMTGRTFVYEIDGWYQHYKALVYYSNYLKTMIRELLCNHRFLFPEYDFAFGEGNDILQSLHYYAIGDPFTVFSVFVPSGFLWIYYDFTILLRLYLSGIAFSCLCFYTQKNINRYGVMAGTLSYVFCFWGIMNANRHPFFLNPMITFPLILLGIEKLLRKEKPNLLILSVFCSAISNFYFFYIIVLMTVAYVVIRLIAKYRNDLKAILRALLPIAGSSILGTMMAGIILLPVLFDFLSDARMESGNAWHLVYPLSYYSNLLGGFFSGNAGYWLLLGFSAPVILAIILLFLRKKEHGMLKACFLSCMVIIMIPALGQVLNGMSYISNRWTWAFSLLCAYIFTVMWPELMSLNLKDAAKLAIGLSICFLCLLMLDKSRTVTAFACIVIAFLFLLVLFPFRFEDLKAEVLWQKRRQAIAFGLVIVGIVNVSFFQNASSAGDYAREALEASYATEQLMLTEANEVSSTAASDGVSDFYRYSGQDLTMNGNTLSGLSSTQYYWSISNPYIAEYITDLELSETKPQEHIGYDDRTALVELSSVLYYVVPSEESSPLPYGFTYVADFNVKENITEEAKALLMEELGTDELSEAQIQVIDDVSASNYIIYRNDHALPIAYTYDSVITEKTWGKLSAVEKQEAMMQAVLLSEYDGNRQEAAIELTSRSLDYVVNCKSTDVTLEDFGFVVTKENSSVTINFEGLADSETYLSIKGLDFDGASTYDLYFGDEKYDPLNLFSRTRWNLLSYSDREKARREDLFWDEPRNSNLTLKMSSGSSKQFNYYTESYNWYNDRHDFTLKLDCTEEALTSVEIKFPKVGIYSFDSMEVICQPMNQYAEQAAALKQNVLKDVVIGVDSVKGTIALDSPRILCLSIPYSTGWTAYVDGKEARLYRANIKNMALALDAGKHKIRLVYHTPWLRAGIVLSAIGCLLFGTLLLVQGMKRS